MAGSQRLARSPIPKDFHLPTAVMVGRLGAVAVLALLGTVLTLGGYIYFHDRDQQNAKVGAAEERIDRVEASASRMGDRIGNIESNVAFVVRDLAVMTALFNVEQAWNRAQFGTISEILRDLQRRAQNGDLTFARPIPGPIPGTPAIDLVPVP